jgi:hypothetical protein
MYLNLVGEEFLPGKGRKGMEATRGGKKNSK